MLPRLTPLRVTVLPVAALASAKLALPLVNETTSLETTPDRLPALVIVAVVLPSYVLLAAVSPARVSAFWPTVSVPVVCVTP